MPLGYGGITSRTGDEAQTDRKAAEDRARAAFMQLPLSFEANEGQTDRTVDFVARGAGQTLFLTPTEAVLSFVTRPASEPGAEAGKTTEAAVRLQFIGANPTARPQSHDPMDARVNYFIGKDRDRWRTDVANYGKVSYAGVYPGVDLVYHGTQGQLEYDFVVAPGADPNVIGLRIQGGEAVRIDDRGDLVVSTTAGDLRQARPTIYQEIGGRRRPVDGSFVLRGDREVGFRLGAYDRGLPLIIDPVLTYSTFLGGTANDFGFGIEVDADGMVYLGGQTSSTTFPRGGSGDLLPKGTTAGAYQVVKGAGSDAFALKFDPNAVTNNINPADGQPAGTSAGALVWATYLGGNGVDAAWDLARDADGNIYLGGSTSSADFPTPNGFDSTCGGGGCDANAAAGQPAKPDVFLAKLNGDGNALLYSTFIGGSAEEQSADEVPYAGFGGIAVGDDTAYVTSLTFSSDFPVTGKAFQKKCGSCAIGLSDSFVSVVDTGESGAASLLYSSFVGGRATEEGKDVAVDDTGRAYLVGHTFDNAENARGNETANNFRTKNALQATYQGGYSDAYVAKVNPFAARAAKTLVYSTFLGGGGTEEGWAVALKPGGKEPYITGYSTSGAPVLAADGTMRDQVEAPGHAGACDAAPDPETGTQLWCDRVSDPVPYFPTTTGPAYAGRSSTDSGSTLFQDGDAFVTVLNEAGNGIVWSRFLGGPGADYGQGIVVATDGAVYVAGWTTCRHPFNDLLPQFYVDAAPDAATGANFDGNHPPTITEGAPTGRNPGTSAQTGVPDCDAPGGAGGFPVVNVSGALASLSANDVDEQIRLMDAPTGFFVAKLTSDGSGVGYSGLLDGHGFDRGFDLALREQPGGNEVYVSGRVGSCGIRGATAAVSPDFPPKPPRGCGGGAGAAFPTTAGAYDTTYNGGGRDTVISRITE